MAEKETATSTQRYTAPHIAGSDSVPRIMWTVVIALLPAAIFSVYINGLHALVLLLASTATAVLAEAATQFLLKRKITVYDGSAAITGLLVAMNMPPDAPVWLAAAGSIFAIFLVKQLFGGLGFNIFNPALAARAFLMASWPAHMVSGWHGLSGSNVPGREIAGTAGMAPEAIDAIAHATPLTIFREGPGLLQAYNIGPEIIHRILYSPDMLKSLFFGQSGGAIGEASVLLILIGGIILLARRVITWHIPVSFIGTVWIAFFAYNAAAGAESPPIAALFQILSGGLFLGAIFMATDMVTSPVTAAGMLLFGFGCGLITFVVRTWGGYPEGAGYAILIMNALTPLIDKFVKPKVFGT